MLTPEQYAAELIRCCAYDVPQVAPASGELSWIASTRRLAQALTVTVGGKTWQAHAVEPRHWVGNTDRQTDQVIMIDGQTLIVVSHITPAGKRDRFRITINGVDVAHRTRPPQMVWHTEAITWSVYRHIQFMTPEPCDALTCRAAPVLTLFNGAAYCAEHIDLYH